MLLKKSEKQVLVLMILHTVQMYLMHRNQMDENLRAFSHEEHWEIILLLVMLLNVIQDDPKCLLILFICNRVLAVAREIYSIHLVKHSFYLFSIVHIRNRNYSDTRLLQELHMRLWNV